MTHPSLAPHGFKPDEREGGPDLAAENSALRAQNAKLREALSVPGGEKLAREMIAQLEKDVGLGSVEHSLTTQKVCETALKYLALFHGFARSSGGSK